MKLTIGRPVRCVLSIAVSLVMSLGVIAGCALSNSAEPSVESAPLAAQSPTATTTTTATRSTRSTTLRPGTETWHCNDKTWWRNYGARYGLDPSAYEQKCGRPMPASWAVPDSESTAANLGSSGSSSSSSSYGASVDTAWKGHVSSSTLQTCIRTMQQPGPHANCSWHVSSDNESLIVPAGPTNIQFFCYDTRRAGSSDLARRHYGC